MWAIFVPCNVTIVSVFSSLRSCINLINLIYKPILFFIPTIQEKLQNWRKRRKKRKNSENLNPVCALLFKPKIKIRVSFIRSTVGSVTKNSIFYTFLRSLYFFLWELSLTRCEFFVWFILTLSPMPPRTPRWSSWWRCCTFLLTHLQLLIITLSFTLWFRAWSYRWPLALQEIIFTRAIPSCNLSNLLPPSCSEPLE